MMKWVLVFYLFLSFVPQGSTQILYDSKFSDQIFFGPNNVYPISQSVCDVYLEELHEVHERYKRRNKHEPKDLEEFRDAIYNLIEGWTLVRDFLFYYYDNEHCKEFTYGLNTFINDQITIVENTEEDYIEIVEYIDIERVKLEKPSWQKRKADKDCISNDPDDCYVLCFVKFKNVYLDYYDNELDESFLQEIFTHSKKNQRFFRRFEIELKKEKSKAAYIEELDQYFSAYQLNYIKC